MQDYIIDKYDIEEDNVIYVVEKWKSGKVVKYIKPESVPEPDPNLISDQEQAQLDMQTNVEYLVALTELNMEV